MSRLSSPRSGPPLPTRNSESPAPAPRRVTRVEPNLLLDPHGMSGTATARRLRASRQRRQWQMIGLSLAGLALLILAVWLVRPQERRLNATLRTTWPFLPAAPATSDGNVLFVAARDGALWRAPLETNPQAPKRVGIGGWAARVAPVVVPGAVVMSAPDGEVSAFETTSNRLLWRRALGGSISTKPLLLGRSLVLGDDGGRVTALDSRTGRTLWSSLATGPVGDGLALARSGGTTFVVAPTLAANGSGGGLQAFDATTGKARWRFPAEARAPAAGIAQPFVDETSGRIFWANDEGAAFALDAATGRKIWKTFARPLLIAPNQKPAPVVLRGAPVLVDGVVLVGGNDGAARGFDSQSGRLLWTSVVGGPIRSAALALGSRVVISGGDDIVVLNARGGRILQRATIPGLVSLVRARNVVWALGKSGELWRLETENG